MDVTIANQQVSPIPGFERYSVDTLGNIYVTETGKKRITNRDKNGYEVVVLLNPSKKPKYVNRLVHRLVLQAFTGFSNLDVNHKDGDKSNNNLSNLEYVTKSENMVHAVANGLTKDVGETHHFAKLSETQVRSICELLLGFKHTYSQIAVMFGVSQSTVNNIAQKHRWVRVSDQYWLGKLHRLAEMRRA